MAKPGVIILRAPGTNCDVETAHAFEQAGGLPEIVHINRVIEEPYMLRRYQILCIPGGFSYGDDIAAGRILASQIDHHLADRLNEFHRSDKLILGICNGFQVLLKTGLLTQDLSYSGPAATLAWNESGRFEDRWVNLRTEGTDCVFLKDICDIYLPVAHAEGKFVAQNNDVLGEMESAGQLVLRYSGDGKGIGQSLPYPANPNGSMANVAGVCDKSGRAFGLMPHPERCVHPTQHPRWTRETQTSGAGLDIFRNAVSYLSN